MRMIIPKTYRFKKFIKDKKQNTVLFENIDRLESYTNNESQITNITTKNLIYHDNIFTSQLIERLRKDSSPIYLSHEQKEEFHRNPKRASVSIYGTSDYWYILLAVNGFSSVYDFIDLEVLDAPELGVMNDIINEEIYVRQNPM